MKQKKVRVCTLLINYSILKTFCILVILRSYTGIGPPFNHSNHSDKSSSQLIVPSLSSLSSAPRFNVPGTIQAEDCHDYYDTTSGNGGVYQSTYEDWGGEFSVLKNSNVNIKIKTPSVLNLQFNWL